MFDPQLLPLVQSKVGKFNPLIAKGFAQHEIDHAMTYVNEIIKSASRDFPAGLVYKGIARVDPYTEYNALIKQKTYDISKSTVYVVKIMFEFEGEPLRDYFLLLPYLEYGSTMIISGSTFAVSPVLIDNAFSVGVDSIFLYANRVKLTFKQVSHMYLLNGERTMDFTVTSDMYFGRNSTDVPAHRLRPTYKMAILATHYLLAKYGIRDMFKKHFGIDCWFGSNDTINSVNFPPEQYTICSSLGVKPQQLNVPVYHPADIAIAVRNEDFTLPIRGVMAGIMYVADWYSDRIKPDLLEDHKLWYHLLALTIKPEVLQEVATLEKLDDHFKSLETFIDDQVRDVLQSAGVNVYDVFDVLVELINTYPERINVDNSTLASMYNKRLVVSRYMLSDVRDNIFKMGFDLQALAKSPKPATRMDIENIMKRQLKPSTVLKSNKHAEVNAVSNPTDNIVPVMTLPVKLQSAMAKKGKAKKFVFTPALGLSASIAEVGNLTSDAGDDFTGRSRLNPYVTIATDGSILSNPELRHIIDRTEADISYD